MPYATAADLRLSRPERDLVELTDPELVAVNDARLETALSEASKTIDGYLAARYPVPMDPAPEVLQVIACDLAFYRLHIAGSASISEATQKQRDDWIAFLMKVAADKAELAPPPATDSGPGATDGGVIAETHPPVFDRASMGAW